ncbi:SsrA-binding protein SmpB [Alkalicoccus chagannorensis]|uniref:SsrA-binding protein SmpB n=1 Tax=Alkalicoccus chagannorensis TaxID=427072 RepID=UPI000411A36F|nr:SsrA-binding protein SmpB [Alkalicoccus chagannorensis]
MATEGKEIARNRKANHDFHIEETFEAGIVLTGTEIKSIRNRRVNLKESFARVSRGEVWIHNMHISTYEQGNRYNHDPIRTRKLLMHKKQINYLIGKTQQKGYTVVPLKIYIKNGVAKVLVGLGKGKKKYDKREDLKRKDANREVQRAFKDANLGR